MDFGLSALALPSALSAFFAPLGPMMRRYRCRYIKSGERDSAYMRDLTQSMIYMRAALIHCAEWDEGRAAVRKTHLQGALPLFFGFRFEVPKTKKSDIFAAKLEKRFLMIRGKARSKQQLLFHFVVRSLFLEQSQDFLLIGGAITPSLFALLHL